MPIGHVKWYSLEKGFGFISSEEGEDVYLASSALPTGVPTVKPGTKLEFGVAEGRRGPQALSVRIIDEPAMLMIWQRLSKTVSRCSIRSEMACDMVAIQPMLKQNVSEKYFEELPVRSRVNYGPFSDRSRCNLSQELPGQSPRGRSI
jgi:cold shock CspA family protein